MYHVINRGNYRAWVFEEDGAKTAFEKCLWEACDQFGWIAHAYCVMGNHYHLALETPEANLNRGMTWLQSTYAMRYNRFRKESGHLFQGRFKSILVEDADRLAWLCHYIHLNPARAGIVPVGELSKYRHSSFSWLMKGKRGRPKALEFGSVLEACGGLKDGPAGRRKYAEYLVWLSEDEPRRKAMLFDRMSRGWALGSRDFMEALIDDKKREVANRVIEGDAGDEAKEILWARRLGQCLKELSRGKRDILSDPKSADWKIAVCYVLRKTVGCRAQWIGERPEAAKLRDRLLSRYRS